MTTDFRRSFIHEIRRRLVSEGQERILKCLELLGEEDIWYRPNRNSNSVGNLVLHLCGNVRQWLFSTIDGQRDVRQRQSEFDERGNLTKSELKSMVMALMKEADQILGEVSQESLLATYRVQGFNETGIAILIHITEHFSYHVGQITYFVKAHKNLDTAYYADQNLDQTS